MNHVLLGTTTTTASPRKQFANDQCFSFALQTNGPVPGTVGGGPSKPSRQLPVVDFNCYYAT